ncbi:hypothetical protein [Cohnella sp. 56]|uniref:hypothetical protein n=1 Tax=Cohnella sp. 56 TaxID=3113722 RepID=UPI0030E81534
MRRGTSAGQSGTGARSGGRRTDSPAASLARRRARGRAGTRAKTRAAALRHNKRTHPPNAAGAHAGTRMRSREDRAGGPDNAHWMRAGAADGAAWRAAHPEGSEAQLRDDAHRMWRDRADRLLANAGRPLRQRLQRYGSAYAAGIGQGCGMEVRFEPLLLNGSASAVVYAAAGAERLAAVLDELALLPLEEIVVVLDDAAPQPWAEALLRRPRIVAAYAPGVYADPHAARAAGARLTGADTVLFADGAGPCAARQLGLLLQTADAEADVALSDRTAREGLFDRRSEAAWLREFLNVSLGKPELRTNAIGSVPYALRRRALDAIGPETLAMPARAQAAALLAGLRVAVCGGVPSAGEKETSEAAARMHAAAWRDCLTTREARLRFPDRNRNRKAIGGGADGTDDCHHIGR